MNKNEKLQNVLTFNDLPQVVAELRDEVSAQTQLLNEMRREFSRQKENRHQPMSLEEAVMYLKIPKSTVYEKLKSGEIPATKPGKRYVLYRDELDKWLEANRRNPVPLTVEEENAAFLALHRRKPNRNSWMKEGGES